MTRNELFEELKKKKLQNVYLFYGQEGYLISNAVKFSPVGGVVKIRLKNLGDQIVFTIDDEGDGIPEDKMQYVFNKFYQADTSHKGEGNGLGLALVKKILDVVGGDVFVENLPEKGCRFTVKINV